MSYPLRYARALRYAASETVRGLSEAFTPEDFAPGSNRRLILADAVQDQGDEELAQRIREGEHGVDWFLGKEGPVAGASAKHLRDLGSLAFPYAVQALMGMPENLADWPYWTEHLHPETLRRMHLDVSAFLNQVQKKAESGDPNAVAALEEVTEDPGGAARHFWLARKGHPIGFAQGEWVQSELLNSLARSFGPAKISPGEDGLIHHS